MKTWRNSRAVTRCPEKQHPKYPDWLKRSAGVVPATMLAICMGLGQTAVADKIVSEFSESYAPNADPTFYAEGFGGWNLGNVEILVSDGAYDETDGGYTFGPNTDYTYLGEVSDDFGTVMGYSLAKDWPVGEPSGIKIVNDDLAVKEPKPTNCIMATSYLEGHFLDSTDPQQVLCSGPFQSHKRYKLAMLPSTVDGTGSESIDLVFNVTAEEGSRDYQVFQKINNWTDGRLEGFTIQVGTGVGSGFVPAGDETNGVGVENLSLSVPGDIWTASQLAVFSAGLFGPPDIKHDRPAGFYDPDTRAGFTIQEYPNVSGQTDTLNSGATLGSDYADVPPGAGLADNQFGPWLPNTMLPYGIFWDDDGNPETDAALLGWYGYNPDATGEEPSYTWMGGSDTGFAPIDTQTILDWGANLEYTSDLIDDLVNVGLNYVVTVGNISDQTTGEGTFTIRITPKVDTSGTGAPGYVGRAPTPSLLYASSEGTVAITPSPEFVTGSLLTARVGDADLNLDPDVAETVDVAIYTSTDMSDTLTLEEQGEDRGVFAAILPEKYGDVPAGTIVSMSYIDLDDGIGGTNVEKTASTTAVDELPPEPVATVLIADFSVPATLFVGRTGKVSVTVQNAKDAEAPVSGSVMVQADGDTVIDAAFTDLAPNRKFRTTETWTATQERIVEWTVGVYVDGSLVASDRDSTSVTVKPGNNNNIGNR